MFASMLGCCELYYQRHFQFEKILADSCSNNRHWDVISEKDIGDDQEVQITSMIGHQDDWTLLNSQLELQKMGVFEYV